jgi:glutathione S-transferase
MALEFFGHPFSSYTQKALIALYENEIEFDYRVIGPDPDIGERFAKLWPLKRFPILVDDGRTILEASIIIEHLAVRHPGPVRLIPEDPDEATEARMMDRFFDNYIHTPVQKHVFNALRPAEHRDPYGVDEARRMLEAAYAWLDEVMAYRKWASGGGFSLADCAAAPALFYADWTHPIAEQFANVRAYRRRLLARPSIDRCVEEGRPFRPYFPLGAPDQD